MRKRLHRSRPRLGLLAAWTATYATLLLALFWSRRVQVPYLFAGGATWLLACFLLWRSRPPRTVSRFLAAALGLLAVSLGVQIFTTWRVERLASEWPQVLAVRKANMDALLTERVGRSVERGIRTAAEAARRGATRDTVALFRQLEVLRERSKVDAIAVFGEAGELIAWAGEHRAQLPEPVRFGISGVAFIEQPLYSYIYFPAMVRGSRQHAVAAILLSTALNVQESEPDDGSVARASAEAGAVFHPGKGPADSWPLVVRGDTVAHARLDELTQSEWREQAITAAQRFLLILAGLIVVLLGLAWLKSPGRRLASTVPLLAATFALALAPLRAFGLDELFSPALFLLPLPGDVSLGTLLGILIALGALAASVQGLPRIPRLPTVWLVLGAVAIALCYPGAIRLLVGPGSSATDGGRAAGMQLLLGGGALWFGLQVAAVLLLGIITELALPRWNWKSPLQATTRVRSPWLAMLIGSLATSAALSILVLLLGETSQWVSPWLAAAWSLPFLLAAFAIAAYRGGGVRLIRWVTAGWLAGSAVLPFMWVAHVDARLRAAELELETLGSMPDAYLDYLLMQFAQEATARARRGESGQYLLYRSWVGSGLANEAYPARLTLWSRSGIPEVQLPLGDIDAVPSALPRPVSMPQYLEAAFARVREYPDSTELMRVQGAPDVNEALIFAVDSAQILTVEVPPRRSLEHPDLPFYGSTTPEATRLDLVPARPGVPVLTGWLPSEDGWRREKMVQYSDGDYHAHMEVRIAPFVVRFARGVLLLAFDLALFTLLWLLGRAARGERLGFMSGWREWRGSFRARVTATLFFFFLVPTAVFGWVAFGAFAREVTRATRIVAERAVEQAVHEYQSVNGDLRALSTKAGAEMLYYIQGELSDASSPESRELGVFGAWMPPDVFAALTRGDQDAAVATRKIGGQDVLTAYRSMLVSRGFALAVPMSLESGETAIRQRELAHLILFAAVIGGLLSLLLSVVVGRALTGPIGQLQRAAAQVGSGNLRVRMPEQTGDEFGELYASFNRMVRRLRRARTQQIRTARVLAWGEMARQVAHEIKNPLTPIKLAVQHLKRAHADGKSNFSEVLDESVDQILIEIDRLSEIARAFSRYGAPAASTGPLEPVNVEQVIHEALTLYRAGDPDVEYREVVESGVPRALGRPGELKEVLLNLLENARAALDAGGTITVSAHRDDAGIALAVADNGPGIPSDFLPRVFDPHFSTRSAGTGLGLAIVRRLVESWGGSVTAESEIGKGTTIRVVLKEAV